MKFEWQEVVDEATPHFTTHRAKIFGGWLVRTNEFWKDDMFGAQSEALVFVQDPKHLWDISDAPDALDIDIEDFHVKDIYFSVRTVRSLKADNIHNLKELLSFCEHQLRKIPNYGSKSLMETKDILRLANLSLDSYPAIQFENGLSKCWNCHNRELRRG